MDLVLARAEAANIPIHSFGYGRSHDPASLWLMSNHTSGTYTFVKDWYDLRDCLAGCIGGMMSIGLLNMKMHIRIVDGQRFRIRKVSGGPTAILSSDGRDVDVDVGEVRYGERKEMLIELELDNSDALRAAANRNGAHRALSATEQFHQSMGLDALSISDSPDLADGMMDGMIDEVPVLEVDGSFCDPSAGKTVSRLGHPVLLTVTLLPSNNSNQRTPTTPQSDPVIVRRRMELLASDMITRALVLVSRKNYPQAQKLLAETRRILHTVLQNIMQNLPPATALQSTGRNRKEMLTLAAVRALQSILQDMQVLSEALEDNVDLFAHDQRNFGAQQASTFVSAETNHLLTLLAGHGSARPEVLERPKCYRTTVLDDRQFYRARVSKSRLGGPRISPPRASGISTQPLPLLPYHRSTYFRFPRSGLPFTATFLSPALVWLSSSSLYRSDCHPSALVTVPLLSDVHSARDTPRRCSTTSVSIYRTSTTRHETGFSK